jgi:uncharacterized protein
MLKKLLKITLFFFFGVQTLFAAAVNDGFVEYKNGNNEQAIEIFKQACENGASSGCYNLGLMYYNGTNVEQEYFKAAEAFSKACDGGHVNACYNLGYMYQNGFGVRLDSKKALSLYEKTCDAGLGASCYNIANMYSLADGVEKDTFKTVELKEILQDRLYFMKNLVV